MIIIEIDSTSTKEKTGTNEKGPWRMVFQQISITGHMQDGFPAKHPRESTIQLDDREPKPYPPGVYALAPESFFFGSFDRFTLGRIKLQPMREFLADLSKQTGAQISFPAKAA